MIRVLLNNDMFDRKLKMKKWWIDNPKISGFNVDYKLFVEDVNAESSYILGFLWADGNFTKNDLRIELVKDDILDIKPIFEKCGKWNYYERQRKKDGENFGKIQACLQTNNKPLCNFLRDMGYTEKYKGFSKIMEHIPKNYHSDFWHGFFDGDGCLYVNDKKNYFTLQFWSSIEQDWSGLIDYINNGCYKIWKYERIKKDGQIHKSSCLGVKNSHHIEHFLNMFYINGLIGLKRKHEKFLKIKLMNSNKKKKHPKTDYIYNHNR